MCNFCKVQTLVGTVSVLLLLICARGSAYAQPTLADLNLRINDCVERRQQLYCEKESAHLPTPEDKQSSIDSCRENLRKPLSSAALSRMDRTMCAAVTAPGAPPVAHTGFGKRHN